MKVRINNVLVGVSKSQSEETPQNNLDRVLEAVKFQFGERPLFITGKDRLLSGIKYPACFAAGWFIGESSNPNSLSELVVLGHGDTFEDAHKNLMNGVKNVYWEEDSAEVNLTQGLNSKENENYILGR